MVKLNNDRYLMAKENDILAFFSQNQIVGKIITGIYPEMMDYGISNLDEVLEELEDISACTHECGIQTDGDVFLELDYSSRLAVQFSGSGGPVILGVVSGNSPCPQISEDLFSLNTLFRDCRGKKITDIIVDRNNGRMLFPCFCGVDMRGEDEGVWRIRLMLEDGSCLALFGSVDWSCVEHLDARGELMTIPLSRLISGCNRFGGGGII